MRRIQDFGFNPVWIGHEDSNWAQPTAKDYSIARVQIDVKKNRVLVWPLASLTESWGFHVKRVAKDPVAVTSVVLKDNSFGGRISFKGYSGQIFGAVANDKDVELALRLTKGKENISHKQQMRPAVECGDPVNKDVRIGNRFMFQMRMGSVGLLKLISYVTGGIRIADMTARSQVEYSFSGTSASLALGSPIEEGIRWTNWVDVTPKYVAPNLWDGFTMDTNATAMSKNSLTIYDQMNRAVLTLALDSLSGDEQGSVEFGSIGTLYLKRRMEHQI